MKKKGKPSKAEAHSASAVREAVVPYAAKEPEAMVRTQIYLNRNEYEFVQGEAARRGEPMAAVIRGYIEEKMTIPEETWMNNPLLQPPVEDPAYTPRGDGVVNHDHYIYGGPKKYRKAKGRWEPLPLEE